MKVVQDLAPNLAILRGLRVLKMMHIRRDFAIRRDWRFYNSCMLNLDMQPVHSYISSPIGPDTLNLTIVVHLGQRPSTLRVFLAGRASVFLLLLPITPAKRQHRFINQISISQALHIHIIIIIFIFSDPGIVVCISISIYLPDLCFGGRQTHARTHAHRDRSIDIDSSIVVPSSRC
jgi:hypothetical protein